MTSPVQPFLETLPPAVRATASQQVLLLEPGGEVSGGVRAIAKALRAGGWPVLGAMMGRLPLYPLFRLGYRVVARLRFLFPSAQSCPP